MIDIKVYALDKVITWLLGGNIFNEIKKMVDVYASEDITGEQKREQVSTAMRLIATGTATFLINLGIEAAVVLLKAQLSSAQATPMQK